MMTGQTLYHFVSLSGLKLSPFAHPIGTDTEVTTIEALNELLFLQSSGSQ